ncbi:hypothetical protein [Actinomadura fibrosa]|uniref:DUF3618 domain-containing protein n=1 Tax=Actinomadura fibrosa TaxID=111802 RepID=A0ABW2XS91_9ACTN|nr:hypothetical protein [Actinomadura fibrosa]
MPPPDDPAGPPAARSADGPGTPRRPSERAGPLIERAKQRIARADQLMERADQRIERANQRIEHANRLLAATGDRLSPRRAPTPISTGEVVAPTAGRGSARTGGDGNAGSGQRAEPFPRIWVDVAIRRR